MAKKKKPLMTDREFKARMAAHELWLIRAAKSVGKMKGMSTIDVLKADPRYKGLGDKLQAGLAQRGPRTPAQIAALKKAQAAAAIANRKSLNNVKKKK